MSDEQSESEQLSHASILYIDDGCTDIIPICDINGFFPRDTEDFDRQQKYKYWYEADEFVYVNILRLGSSIENIEEQNRRKRLRFPNKRNRSFFSESDCEAREIVAEKRTTKRKLSFDDEEETTVAEKEELLLTNREKLIDSDNSTPFEEEDRSLDLEEGEEKLVDEPNLSNGNQISQSDDTAVISPQDGIREVGRFIVSRAHINQNINNNSIKHKSTASRRTTSPEKSSASHGIGARQSASEGRQERSAAAVEGPSVPLATTPPQNRAALQNIIHQPTKRIRDDNRRVVSPVRRAQLNQVDPHPRFVAENDQVYIGAGRYLYEDTWALMLMKNDSRFVRDVAETLWGREVLKKRYIRKPINRNSEKENNVDTDEEENGLQPLTPEKYQLVKDALRLKI